jgi:hypothetical protein
MVNDGGTTMPPAFEGSVQPILDGEAMGFMQKEMMVWLDTSRTRISAWKSAGRAPTEKMKKLRQHLDAVVQGKEPPPADRVVYQWWLDRKEDMGNEIDRLLERAEDAGLTLEQVAKSGGILPRTLKYWRRTSRRIHRDAFKRMENYVDQAAKGHNVQSKAAPSNGQQNTSVIPPIDSCLDFNEKETAEMVQGMVSSQNVPPESEVEPAPAEPEPVIKPSPEPAPATPSDIALYLVKHGSAQVAADTLIAAVNNIINKILGEGASASDAQRVFDELKFGALGYSVTDIAWRKVDEVLEIQTSWTLKNK